MPERRLRAINGRRGLFTGPAAGNYARNPRRACDLGFLARLSAGFRGVAIGSVNFPGIRPRRRARIKLSEKYTAAALL